VQTPSQLDPKSVLPISHSYVTIRIFSILEYLDPAGRSPFGDWFDELDATAAAKVTIALARMAQGNHSNAKSVGEDVLEYRIDFGPGYRLYFRRDGRTLLILLGGGTKQRQQRDIEDARRRWADYRQRKQRE
jgi:putative addiction module killer protein